MMLLLIVLLPALLRSAVVLATPVRLKVSLRMTKYLPQVQVPVEDSLDLDLFPVGALLSARVQLVL